MATVAEFIVGAFIVLFLLSAVVSVYRAGQGGTTKHTSASEYLAMFVLDVLFAAALLVVLL